MSVAVSQPQEEEFVEAQKNWDLEQLYLDLAHAKQKALTPVEKKLLRGLLCSYSPAEIAQKVYHSSKSGTVRVYLSNGIYKYIEEMLSQQKGYSVKLKNWSHVTHLLENAGYKRKNFVLEEKFNLPVKNSYQYTKHPIPAEFNTVQDWGEAIDVSNFCGRKVELAQVSEWILQQDCRLVTILGMNGIGKTAFSVKLAQEIQDQFEYVIWRSLHLFPSMNMLLTDLMQILSPTLEIDESMTLNQRISQLLERLREVRCLIVFDDFHSVISQSLSYPNYFLAPNNFNQSTRINYYQNYEAYSELISRVANSQHQSCLLITSREKPPKLVGIEGEKLPVKSLNLTGLDMNDSLSIVENQGLATSDYTDINILINHYSGNPLFLKLVTATIKNMFCGNIYQFLEYRTFIFGDIRKNLDQQFSCLSEIEKYIMYWLVLNPDVKAVFTLNDQILPVSSSKISSRIILENLESLQQKSYIYIQSANIFIFQVWKEYIIQYLQEQNLSSKKDIENLLLSSDQSLVSQLK
ncbi:MAG: ATP-binding protein [Sphaerospermopsis sp. SIO1G1]|nr:ATP-binding protein [Sphaerospermopsis sp. SIO1G1]